MKKLKIGFDVDDVLNKFTYEALTKMEEHFKKPFCYNEVEYGFGNFGETACIFAHELFRNEDFIGNLEIPKEYVDMLQILVDRGHDVFFATSTYSSAMTARALRLAEQIPFIHPRNYIMTGRKDMLNFDVMFDDNFSHIEGSMAEIPVVVDKPWNKSPKKYLRVSQSADEYMRIIEMAENGMTKQDIYKRLNPKHTTNNGKGIIVVGASGSGKTTIVEKAMQESDSFVRIITHTTRDMRTGETPDISYHFNNEADFLQMVENGKMLEYTKYAGNYYGTSTSSVNEALALAGCNKCVIAIMDFNGAKALTDTYPDQFVSVFIDRDKDKIMENILERDIPVDKKRERIKQLELDYKNKNNCNYCIQNNGTVEEAVAQLLDIVF